MSLHRDLEPFRVEGGLFDVEPCELDLSVGRRGKVKDPAFEGEKAEFTITGVQKIYDGRVFYRVVFDTDTHKFGRPLDPKRVELIS